MDQADKLNRAAGKGDEEAVRRLLATGARADGQCQWGDLPLHEDSLGGHEGVAASAVQPALDACVGAGPHSATLYADLAARLPLSQEQWSSIPAPCPDLARALPTVLQRSAAEAGWLVGRLAEGQRKRLRAAALSLARAQRGVPSLPAELCGRILALCLLDP
ncbi:hypothetical protein CHLNCDRAFT_135923 [Chlorella variabilis]|uniref:Uncharacterized protein n=1 Tax=Chlorella variabilis TaxID=554065 RepID=E1ZJD6_CHLVA|nr:hypothetical protein CHLNCDRAFT_135923 [Chlorella variabilis]EFN53978.1 hypothetical protein CHLNCDRAFT_135923 [Chlorella variabilis]|eukprot:XP_005846080.1 hypothetical protein CHLNCDRAFT_135923 [Chlorella variabilis]